MDGKAKVNDQAQPDEEVASLPADAGPFLALALRKGVHAQRAFAAWCQEAIESLGDPPAAEGADARPDA